MEENGSKEQNGDSYSIRNTIEILAKRRHFVLDSLMLHIT